MNANILHPWWFTGIFFYYSYKYYLQILSDKILLNYGRSPYDQFPNSQLSHAYPMYPFNVQLLVSLQPPKFKNFQLFHVYFFIHNVLNPYRIRRSLYYVHSKFFSVLEWCWTCADLHPRGEAVRRSLVSNVLEDIANTENMDFWMKEGLEELEEVRTEQRNLFTISKRRAKE